MRVRVVYDKNTDFHWCVEVRSFDDQPWVRYTQHGSIEGAIQDAAYYSNSPLIVAISAEPQDPANGS